MVTEISLQQSLLTVEQVAKRLSIQERTVREWFKRRILHGFKINNEWRMEPLDLEQFIEERKRQGRDGFH